MHIWENNCRIDDRDINRQIESRAIFGKMQLAT